MANIPALGGTSTERRIIVPRRVTVNDIPTDADIRRYQNVPVDVAARYLGSSPVTIHRALQDGRAPFGFAAKNPDKDYYTYQISPERLIRYQAGELPMYNITEIMRYAAAGIEDLLEAKTKQLSKLASMLIG